jgi:hypothetical protein
VGEVSNDGGGSNGGNGGDNYGDVQDRGESCMLLFLITLSSTAATHHRFAAPLVLLAGREEGLEMVLRVRRKQLVLDAVERASWAQTR